MLKRLVCSSTGIKKVFGFWSSVFGLRFVDTRCNTVTLVRLLTCRDVTRFEVTVQMVEHIPSFIILFERGVVISLYAGT